MGKGKKKGGIPISGASAAVAAPKASVDVYSGLNRDEIQFLSKVTRDFGDVRGNSASHGKGNTSTTSHHAFVAEAERILEEHNMIIIENILTPLEVDTLHGEYIALHENQGTQQAIGEKDASKRSGTRMYNCQCQLGPKCGFMDWKNEAAGTKSCLAPADTIFGNNNNNSGGKGAAVWVDICRRFHLEHVARVEVVTSHVGCRAQDWHIDGTHGLTVIFPLTDVALRQGPTELDFRVPFLGLREGSAKVKTDSSYGYIHSNVIHAVMNRGSVIMFNANVSHRGSANIGSNDRPILVLDTSLPTACLPAGAVNIWERGVSASASTVS